MPKNGTLTGVASLHRTEPVIVWIVRGLIGWASPAAASVRTSVMCLLAAESIARDMRAGVARAGVSSLLRRNSMKPAQVRRKASSVSGGGSEEAEEVEAEYRIDECDDDEEGRDVEERGC